MIPLDSLTLYAVACVLLVLTPGPNLMYLISRTLCQGRTAGVVSLAGTTSGMLFYAMAAAFGLTAVFVAIPVLFDVVRLAGAAYLLWLAWDAIRPRGGGGPFCAPRPAAGGAWRAVPNRRAHQHPQSESRALLPGAVPAVRRSRARQRAAAVADIGRRADRDRRCGRPLFVLAAARVARWLAERPAWITAQRWVLGGVFAAIAAQAGAGCAADEHENGHENEPCC